MPWAGGGKRERGIIVKLYVLFSEAIRDGAKLRPNQLYYKSVDVEANAACATGAGLEAIFGEPPTTDCFRRYRVLMRKHYGYLANTRADFPCGCSLDDALANGEDPQLLSIKDDKTNLWGVIIHLNNTHQWTRERIADWLETEEEKLGFVALIEAERVAPSFVTVTSKGQQP